MNYLKKNIYLIAFIVTSLLNELFFRLFALGNIFNIKAFISTVIIICIIASFSFLVKKERKFAYFLVFTIIFTAACIISSVYYGEYKRFPSILLLKTTYQMLDMPGRTITSLLKVFDFIYLWQVIGFFLLRLEVKKRCIVIQEKNISLYLKSLSTSLICFLLFFLLLPANDRFKLKNDWNREYIVRNFGLYAYYLGDITKVLKETTCKNCGYDKAYENFTNFYKTKETKTNEYTNIFKDKSVIFIHAESIQTLAMGMQFNNLEVTPNLNKLAKEGIFFSNFYAQESSGTSSDTEYTLNTGLLPVINGNVFINKPDNTFYSIPNILTDYYNFSMHGNLCTFWNRENVHKNLGYDKFYCHTKDYTIDNVLGLGLLDESFFKQSVAKIKDIAATYPKYYGTMLMLTNHIPFDVNEQIDEYKVNFQNKGVTLPYLEGSRIGNYFKLVHYADSVIGQFIDDLEKENLLEDLVIVIYGDHDSRLQSDQYELLYNYDFNTGKIKDKSNPNYIKYDYLKRKLDSRVPLIIWSKEKQFNLKIDKVMGMYDILPTVGNMFGFSSPYALGNDIFSTEQNVVVFPNGNWITDDVYYNNQNDEYNFLNNNKVDEKYLEKYNNYSQKIVEISRDILKYDFFKNVTK